MTWRNALDDALDGAKADDGVVEVECEHGRAKLDVAKKGPIGVRVRQVDLSRSRSAEVGDEAARLGRELRALGEHVRPTEVAPALGGAVLRTDPEEMRNREFFEVGIAGADKTSVKRVRVSEEGERTAADWDMTREQLDRLLGELS